ncbi:MAG: glycosyltransferase family 32 protein [Boseongicola sp.]
MTDKLRLNRVLEAAATLRDAGQFDEAERLLSETTRDPKVGALGPLTSLGLPRRLQSAMLKLAKARGDLIRRIAYQYHLVPPPDALAEFVQFSLEERLKIARINSLPVPRVLHQIWIGDKPLPSTCAAWADHARAHGYEYRIWREDDLEGIDLASNSAFVAMLERGDYPGAVDIARYQILAREGGIYLDCDWYPAREDISFHDLLPMRGLTALAEGTPRNTGIGSLLLANSMIAAPPDHPVMLRLNEVLGKVMSALPEGPAWWTTGPLIFTLAARNGAVTIADANFIVGSVPRNAPMSDVAAIAANPANSGLLIAWKSW